MLVIPAFLTTDLTTKPLRRFLDRCGYRVFGWRLGVNWGPTAARRLALRARLEALAEREGGPISLVGVSLGGLLARDLAYDRPQAVRQVITLASPVRLPTASTLEPLFKLMAPFYDTDLDVARLRRPLPVPAMALYTREDGIVAWQSCVGDEPGDGAADVGGAHVTICRNPAALALVARRLAAVPGPPSAGPKRLTEAGLRL